MPEGRVIGFVHADRYHHGTPIGSIERDVLWAFAEGFGYAGERTAILERIRSERERLRAMAHAAESAMDRLCDVDGALPTSAAATAGDGATAAPVAPDGRPLTRRQTEVIRLLAEGATNAEIAARLYLSRRTVDNHVAAVLARLGVRSRHDARQAAVAMGLLPPPGTG
jgi:DNA-binding NarL/FixJ family response regulator